MKSMKSPMVSVITPTFNRPKLLERALHSMNQQTYKNFEVVVINDGDIEVDHVINKYSASLAINYIKTKGRIGLPAARNIGINLATGKYIAYLDDDDIFLPNHLKEIIDSLLETGYKVGYANSLVKKYILENGDLILKEEKTLYNSSFDKGRLLYENYIPVIALIHEKGCFDIVGLFDETFRTHEDWDMWIKLSLNFEFLHINSLTSEITYIPESKSITTTKVLDFENTRAILYNRYQHAADLNVKEKQYNKFLEIYKDLVPYISFFFLDKNIDKVEDKHLDGMIKNTIAFFNLINKSDEYNFISYLLTNCVIKNRRLSKIERPFIRINFPEFMKI